MKRERLMIDAALNADIQRAVCAYMCETICGKRIASKEVSIMPSCTMQTKDAAAAEAAKRRIVRLAVAGENEKACFAYTEMSMVSKSFDEAQCVDNIGFGTDEADNSTEIHPYYVRFSADSRGWLDIVTAKREGNQIITKPVSVKALHGWLEHARKYDQTVFAAAIID